MNRFQLCFENVQLSKVTMQLLKALVLRSFLLESCDSILGHLQLLLLFSSTLLGNELSSYGAFASPSLVVFHGLLHLLVDGCGGLHDLLDSLFGDLSLLLGVSVFDRGDLSLGFIDNLLRLSDRLSNLLLLIFREGFLDVFGHLFNDLLGVLVKLLHNLSLVSIDNLANFVSECLSEVGLHAQLLEGGCGLSDKGTSRASYKRMLDIKVLT